MSKQITLTWRGHSCFKVQDENFSLLLDPYLDGKVPGLNNLRDTAHLVLCSHSHDDHGYREAIELVDTDVLNPFAITTVECPHDDAGGSKRGMNQIHVFDNGTLRIAHFGDIGCPLDEEQRSQIGQLDAAMIPVGGFYTMEPAGIQELLEQLNPRVVIPMHYRTEEFGFPVIRLPEDFLQLRDDVVQYDTNVLTITKNMPKQTAVLRYLG